MRIKSVLISVLLIAALAVGLSAVAAAQDAADVRMTFVEDSGSYAGKASLVPEGVKEGKYLCEYRLSYGWLCVEEAGDFRYELDAEDTAVAAARKDGQSLTEKVTIRCRDENGRVQLLYPSFLILPEGEQAPADGYALVNNGENAAAEGSLFAGKETQGEKEQPKVLGVICSGGEYMVDGELSLSYTLDNSSWEVQMLSAGERGVYTLAFRLRGEDGSTINRTVNILVYGADDVPVLCSFTHELSLAGERSVSGSALSGSTAGDGYSSQQVFAWTTLASAAQYGTMTLNADGSYTYALNVNNAAVRAMAAGAAPLSESFAYSYKDKDGSRATGSVTIKVVYSDIAPWLPRYENSTGLTVTEDSDADNDAACYTVSGNMLTGATAGNGTNTFAWTSAATSVYGTVQLNGGGVTGAFSYRLDNGRDSVQALRAGENVTETYNCTYTDADGDVAYGCFTVTIRGANDTPSVNDAGTFFIEDSGANVELTGSALTGRMLGDGTEARHIFEWTTAASAARFGTMELDVGGVKGRYKYTVDNASAAVQALKEGEEQRDVFTFKYTDVDGDYATGSITITIFGKNDVPTVKSFTHELTLANRTVSGNALTDSTPGDGVSVFAWAAVDALYGTMTRNADGTYVYTVDQNNPAVGAMTEGAKLSEPAFGYTYTDGDDPAEVATGSVNITIEYSDIDPTVQTCNIDVSEDGSAVDGYESILPITGTVLTGSTLGNGTAAQHSCVLTSSPPTPVGTLTLNADGTYSYTFDPAATQSYADGQLVILSYKYKYKDRDGDAAEGTININIHGVNDAPVLVTARVNRGINRDGSSLTVSGSVNDSTVIRDADTPSSGLSFTWSGTGQYGTAILGADGSYSYTLNAADSAVLALTGADEYLTESFTFLASDGYATSSTGELVIKISVID